MSDIDLAQVRAQVEILKLCKTKIAEFKALEKRARDAIESLMKPGDVGLLDGEPAIHWTSYKSNKFDQSAFGEDYPELLAQYKMMKEVNRFEVVEK